MKRMRRTAYAIFVIVVNLIVAGLYWIATGGSYDASSADSGLLVMTGVSALILGIAIIGMSVRRLHDMGASGWWAALGFVPLANLVLLIVLLVWPGTRGPNDFGRDPRGRHGQGRGADVRAET